MRKKFVIHNGVKMSADWPDKIAAAQTLTHYTIGGQRIARIHFGDDDPRWGQKPCLDCGVLKGQLHVPDCEYEKCPGCGEKRAGGCFCDTEELREPGEEPIAPPSQSVAGRRVHRFFTGLCWLIIIVILLAFLRSILMLFGI